MDSPAPPVGTTTAAPPPGDDGPPPARRRSTRSGVALLVLGLVALVAACAFPFAPVQQPEVRYSWPQDGATTPVAVPLMPFQPVRFEAMFGCAALRPLEGRTVVSTLPPRPDPTANPLPGLTARTSEGRLLVDIGGTERAAVALPPGDCTVALVSTPDETTVAVDGRTAARIPGDVRPAVVGIFSDAPSPAGLSVRLTADTRFQTTAGPVKITIAVLGVLALVAALVLLRRREGPAPVRLLPRGWWRPRGPDAAVTVALALWWLVGPITVDDGYITGIVRSRGPNGFVGNVYRWLNAPEAPFSWFYDLDALWAQVSTSSVWLRLPSVLLALLTWFLLSRCVLRRLVPRRRIGWLAALAYLAWVLTFVPSMRPEPWVSLGLLAVVPAVERGIALRRATPLAIGLLVAGVTTALTPGGLMAFAPFLAGAVPVLRTLRRRAAHVGAAPLVVVLLAAVAASAFLMVSDQSLAAMLEATRVRTLIGGGAPWYDEYTRYSSLLGPGDLLGPLGRRLPVLFTLLAAGGVLWAVSRRGTGLPAGPSRRIVATFLLGLAAMTATPTKWTLHFGDLAGVGAAVLVLGLVVGSTAVLRRRAATPGPALLGLGSVVVAGSLVLAGWNNWPFVSNWWGLTWSTVAPFVAGYPLALVWLVVGLVLLAVLAARVAWRRSAGRSADPPRWQPSPAAATTVLAIGVVLLLLGSFTRTGLTHRGDYTLLSDALRTVRGDPCGLQSRLSVETRPADGLLAQEPGPDETGPVAATEPVDVGGSTLPGVRPGPILARTPWYRLDPEQTASRLPVVVSAAGTLGPGRRLIAEFSDGRQVVAGRDVEPDGPAALDRRLMAPDGATQVRLRSEQMPGPVGVDAMVASLPRVPRLDRMTDVLPPGTTAVLDWPVAFLFGCLSPAPLPDGTASVPGWRVAPPQTDDAAGITYAPQFGGPFAGSRLLVVEQRMATYLDGDPTRDAVQVYRWVPSVGTVPGRPTVEARTVSGLASDGHARVPGLE